MISLDYDDTIMAAAGHQAEAILEETKREVQRQIHPRGRRQSAAQRRRHVLHRRRQALRREAEMRWPRTRMAIIAWGACASWGCVQAAKPNPTQATPIDKVIPDKPIIKVPGCPPIAEVMTGVVTYITDLRPPARARPPGPAEDVLFASASTTSATAGRISTPASSSRNGTTRARARATASTRWAARARPPTTPARPCAGTAASPSRSSRATAASAAPRTASGTRARSTTGSPTSSQFGVEKNADEIGLTAAGVVGAAVAAHAARHRRQARRQQARRRQTRNA